MLPSFPYAGMPTSRTKKFTPGLLPHVEPEYIFIFIISGL